jgi:hypothetical protein
MIFTTDNDVFLQVGTKFLNHILRPAFQNVEFYGTDFVSLYLEPLQ